MAHPEPLCSNPDPVLVKIFGISGEGLFSQCQQCKAMWHRWSPGDPLYAKAQEIMDRWTASRARRADPKEGSE